MPKSYLLNGIDEELLKKYKIVCVYLGTSMKDALILHMMHSVKDFDFIKLSENKIKSEPEDLFK